MAAGSDAQGLGAVPQVHGNFNDDGPRGVERRLPALYRSKLSANEASAAQCCTLPPEVLASQSLCGSLRDGCAVKTSQRAKMQEEVRFRVLRLLQDDPEMSQRDLARAVGISTGGMHYVLSALVDRGLVKLGNFTAAPDRRRYAYVLTPQGLSEKARLTHAFLRRKRAEYEALRDEIAALSAELDEAREEVAVPVAVQARESRT